MMVDRLQADARAAAASGQRWRADRLAGLEADLVRRFRTADGFGLDRKQEFLVAVAKMHAFLHAA